MQGPDLRYLYRCTLDIYIVLKVCVSACVRTCVFLRTAEKRLGLLW